MRLTAVSVTITCWLLLTCQATAGPIGELGKEAEAQVEAGKYVEAVDSIMQGARLVFEAGPLGFRRVLLVTEDPPMFSAYTPRENSIYKQGEKMFVYAEPIGVTWKQQGEFYSFKVVGDWEIRSKEGEVLGGKRGAWTFALSGTREPVLALMIDLTLNFPEIPLGSYVLGITFHDDPSGKKVSADLPFEIK